MNRGLDYQGSFATFRWHSTARAEFAPHLAFRGPFSLADHGSETIRPLPLWIPAAQEANLLSRSFFLLASSALRRQQDFNASACFLDQQWGRYGRIHADLSLFWLIGGDFGKFAYITCIFGHKAWPFSTLRFSFGWFA